MKAPLPPNEAQRLTALRSYGVLDTPPEQAFDDLILLAAHICEVPKAIVSLIDEDRQWFKARSGVSQSESSRDIAFCAHTILRPDEVLEVPDTLADARFADNPLVVAEPPIRFYAGAPLVTPAGYALGTLCVLDTVPRSLTPAQLAALQALSRRAVAQLELRRQARELSRREEEASRMLLLAEKSRRALLSVLEDEKLAMASLRESETRFRQMAESINEVFWMRDVETDRIIYISPGFDGIWGRSRTELYAAPEIWGESIQAEDRERVLRASRHGQLTGEYDETYRINRPDGAMRWIRARAFPVKQQDGRVRRIVGIAEDVTEQRKMEEQFLHVQRMEAIGTLAAGVAHDLNNILSPILMVAGLLKRTHPDASDQELLGLVESGARRGADVIRQLMLFSRGMAGERIIVQVRHLIRELTRLLRETFPRDIVIREMAPNDLWPVLGDTTQLHQILMNLCVNARDAMPAGGQLTIGAENAVLSATDPRLHTGSKAGRYLIISVVDTGGGIPPEVAKRMFDPFFTTKPVGKGTGLGLSTVAGIVKSHGGFISHQSEPSQGTQFTVYLPAAADGTNENGGRIAPDPARGGGELLLVVDDEASIREITCDLLKENNYQVLSAADGAEALALFRQQQHSVRLVLTDIMMPNMDGLALTRALRAVAPGLAIIATTGLDQETRKEELSRLGVSEILLKPCEAAELLAAVWRSLGAQPHK